MADSKDWFAQECDHEWYWRTVKGTQIRVRYCPACLSINEDDIKQIPEGIVCQYTRDQSFSERQFWDDINNGKNIIPPRPCRECGLVWQHDPKCITQTTVGVVNG